MRRRAVAAWIALAACSNPKTRGHRRGTSPQADVGAARPAPMSSRPPFPTLANAGAKTCVVGEAVSLGPHGAGDAVLAFDRVGGLAAWKRDPMELALQTIALDGARLGAPRTVAVPDGVEPRAIYALGQTFVVLLRRWDWQHDDLRWWGVAVPREGRVAEAPVDLGLADMDLRVAQPLDERRVSLIVVPGQASRHPRPARRQTLEVRPDGGLLSTAVALDLRDLEPAVAAVLDRPRGALTVAITNAAVPPPRGPGGTTYEAMGRPIFERRIGGERIGDPLPLESHGNPIAHGMYIDDVVAWSGTHFVYPFWEEDGGPSHDTYVVRLLPIDCRP